MEADSKLYEAEYFLERMKERVADRKAFCFNLSAFLSAARSVILILPTELKNKPGFDDWYQKMQKDPLLEFFRVKRNYNVHVSAIDPKGKIAATFHESISISESVTITQTKKNGTKLVFGPYGSEPKETPKPESSVEYKYFFEDHPYEDVITLCSRYLDKLAVIVNEARRFLI